MSAVSNTDEQKDKSAGTILREAREARGLSLDDAARVTRIGKGHLAALEDGLYDKLPSRVYVKGFLRVYAAYLKLPENEVLQAYERGLTGHVPVFESGETLPGPQEDYPQKSASRFRWSYLIPVAVVLAAASSYFFLSSPMTNKPGKKQFTALSSAVKPTAAVMTPVTTAKVGIEAQNREKQGNEDTANNSESPMTPSPATKGMVLKIKVIEDGWLDITIDDAITQHYDLKAGDMIEWKGEKSISLDVGNAGGVEAELDGKALKTLGKSGETAHVVLKQGAIAQ